MDVSLFLPLEGCLHLGEYKMVLGRNLVEPTETLIFCGRRKKKPTRSFHVFRDNSNPRRTCFLVYLVCGSYLGLFVSRSKTGHCRKIFPHLYSARAMRLECIILSQFIAFFRVTFAVPSKLPSKSLFFRRNFRFGSDSEPGIQHSHLLIRNNLPREASKPSTSVAWREVNHASFYRYLHIDVIFKFLKNASAWTVFEDLFTHLWHPSGCDWKSNCIRRWNSRTWISSCECTEGTSSSPWPEWRQAGVYSFSLTLFYETIRKQNLLQSCINQCSWHNNLLRRTRKSVSESSQTRSCQK